MQIITQINTKIFTWKTRCGKNHGTGVHLKTSTITNNGFTIVLPQIQLRATTYISSRTTYFRITTRLKENYLRKTHNTDSPVFCQNDQLPHHQSSIQPFRMKRNVSRSCCQNLSPIQRWTNWKSKKERKLLCCLFFFSFSRFFSSLFLQKLLLPSTVAAHLIQNQRGSQLPP